MALEFIGQHDPAQLYARVTRVAPLARRFKMALFLLRHSCGSHRTPGDPLSNQLSKSREDRINESIRDLAQKVRELRRDLEELLATLKIPSRLDDALLDLNARRHT